MKVEQINSVQEWLPFAEILDKGIIKMKDSSYIKILNINPINYILKSSLEKEAILNSYSNIFKTCNFNFQILIQSKKEDLKEHIKKIKENKDYIVFFLKCVLQLVIYINKITNLGITFIILMATFIVGT